MPDDDNPYQRSQILQDLWQRHVPQPDPPQVGGNFGTMTPQEAATARTPGTVLDEMVTEAAGLPKQIFESSESLRQGGDYDPAPTVEALSMLTGLGAPAAEAGAAGIFGGKLARTADQAALRQAMLLDQQGVAREEIYRTTGWFRGRDGEWRFEISDKPMQTQFGSGTAADLITHPDLFNAYPELGSMRTQIDPSSVPGGVFNQSGVEMWGKPEQIKQIAAHELQHAVQGIEGFERGTNMQAAGGQDPYHRTAGEVEARNTERRIDLGPKTRRTHLPWETEDVPAHQQILKRVEDAREPEARMEGEGIVRKIQKPGRWPTYEATRRGETKQFKDPEQAKRWATSPEVQRPDVPLNPLERPPWE